MYFSIFTYIYSDDLKAHREILDLNSSLQVKSKSKKTLFIPILNFPEDDLPLKTEVNAVLARLGIATSQSFVFKDSLPLFAGHVKEVTLLDHNQLADDISYLHNVVANIIGECPRVKAREIESCAIHDQSNITEEGDRKSSRRIIIPREDSLPCLRSLLCS